MVPVLLGRVDAETKTFQANCWRPCHVASPPLLPVPDVATFHVGAMFLLLQSWYRTYFVGYPPFVCYPAVAVFPALAGVLQKQTF